MAHLHFYSHSDRGSFDPYGVAQKMANKNYRHKDNIEYYWANCHDEFEVIKRNHSRLLLKLIILYVVKNVPYQVENEEDPIQYHDYM